MFSIIAMSIVIGVAVGAGIMRWLDPGESSEGRHAYASRPVGADGLPPSRTNLSQPIATSAATYHAMPPTRSVEHPSLLNARSLDEALAWLATDRVVREQQRRDFTQYLADIQTRWALRPAASRRLA
jgi:hypothetical protein